MGRNLHVIVPLAATLLVGACVGTPVAPDAGTNTVSLGGGAAGGAPAAGAGSASRVDQAFTKAMSLGLRPGNHEVAPNQLQVITEGGQPIQGATVKIGTFLGVTDEKGRVTLPEGASDGNTLAKIQAPGMVPRNITVAGGMAAPVQAVDSARTPLTAAAGGIAVNAAGTMRVKFAPGSLTKDVDVAVTRGYLENAGDLGTLPPHVRSAIKERLDAGKGMLGVYSYNMDLRDAKIAPGGNVSVEFKVEPLMQGYLERMSQIPGWLEKSEFRDTFRREGDGTWWFSMAVPAAPAAPEGVTEGPGKASYKLKAAACNNITDVETYYVLDSRVASRTAYREKWVEDWRQVQRRRGVQSCDSRDNSDGQGNLAIHDPDINGGHCFYAHGSCSDYDRIWYEWERYDRQTWEAYTEYFTEWFWAERKRNHYTSTINARVTYSSDDPRFAGKPVGGVLVNFSHEGTPLRAPTSGGYTAGDGFVSASGKQGASGSCGVAASEAYTWGTSAGYGINCGTVDLYVVKNRPRVTIATSTRGGVMGGAVGVNTNLGNVSVNPGGSALWTPGIDGSSQTLTAGGNWNRTDYWLDLDANATGVHWNGSFTMPVTLWYSRPLGAIARWISDDASVPADQQPGSKWNGQSVSSGTFSFQHAVSEARNKPGNRDVMRFDGVPSAATWGLSGAQGSVSFSRNAGAATFGGSAATVVDGRTVTVDVAANLPRVTMNIQDGDASKLTMVYRLTRSDGQAKNGTMEIQTRGGQVTFAVPVEDPLNTAYTHKLEILSMRMGLDYTVTLADGSDDFPPVNNLRRGLNAVTYPALKSTFVSAK